MKPVEAVEVIDRHLTAPAPSAHAAAVRIAAAVAMVVRLVLRDWSDLVSVPVYEPAGVVSWLSSRPDASVLTLAQVVGVTGGVLAILVCVGRAPVRLGRPSLVTCWLALVLLAAIRDATHAKVLHNDVLMVLALAPIAWSAGDARLGDHRRAVRWGWPRRVALAVTAAAYFLTGYQKLRVSGLSWVTSDNLRWVMIEGQVSDRAPTELVSDALIAVPVACHVLAAVTLLVELTAPLVLASTRTRAWFFVAAAALHGGIWLTLGLDYWGWIATVGVVALPWHRLTGAPARVSRAGRRSAGSARR